MHTVQQENVFQVTKYQALAICGGLSLVAFLLRIYQLGAESLWLDEAYSVSFCDGTLYRALTAERTTPPLYYLVLHFWIHLFGRSEESIRLLSVFPSTAAVLLTYVLGTRLYSTSTGVLAAIMMCISSFQIYYAQEARSYVLLLPLVICSSLLLLRILSQTANRWVWLGYICCAVLALYTHIYGAFILAAQNIVVAVAILLRKSSARPLLSHWGMCQLLLALLYLPWLIRMSSAVSTFDTPRRHLLLKFPQVVFSLLFGNQLIPIDEQSILNIQATLLAHLPVILLAVIATSSLTISFLARFKQNSFVHSFVIINALVPLILSYGLSLVAPIFDEGYLIETTPFFSILLAAGVTSLSPSILRYLLRGSFILVIGLELFGLQRYYFDERFGKEQWRDVVADIERVASKDDAIVFDRHYHDVPFRYYQTMPIDTLDLRELEKADSLDQLGSELTKTITPYNRIWLVKIRNRNQLIETLIRQRYTETEKTFYPKDKGITVLRFDRTTPGNDIQ